MRLLPVVVWVGVYLIWLEFGGNPFNWIRYLLDSEVQSIGVKSHLSRYCGMISVPMAVLVGALLVKLGDWAGTRARAIATAGTCAAGLFFINFNALDFEGPMATKEALAHARSNDLFPLYLDSQSHDIARYLMRGDPRAADVKPYQRHDWRAGETALVDLETASGYLLLNQNFTRYKSRRYFMEGLTPAEAAKRFPVVHQVDNPAPAPGLSYAQARFLVAAASLLPSQFLRDKIAGTGGEMLEPGDAVVVKLAGQ